MARETRATGAATRISGRNWADMPRGIHIGSRESVDSIVGRLPVMPGTCNAAVRHHQETGANEVRYGITTTG